VEGEEKLRAQAGSSPVDEAAMTELNVLRERARRMITIEERKAVKKARETWEEKYLREALTGAWPT
jgi:hypothetical protein